jgi:hypothetical protein
MAPNHRRAAREHPSVSPSTAASDGKAEHLLESPKASATLTLLFGGGGVVSLLVAALNLWVGLALVALVCAAIIWLHSTEYTRLIKKRIFARSLYFPTIAVVLLLVVAGLVAQGQIRASADSSQVSNEVDQISQTVSNLEQNSGFRAAQITKLEEIEDFIGDKDEAELRDMFDLSDMMFNNLGMVRDSLIHPGKPSSYASFFHGGQAFLDLRFMKRLPDSAGKINYAPTGVYLLISARSMSTTKTNLDPTRGTLLSRIALKGL